MTSAANPSSQAAAYLDEAEREVRRIPETRASTPRTVASVGVIGGGTMGAGIAVALLDASVPVIMIERDDAALARGVDNVQRVYRVQVDKGRLTQQQMNERLARFNGSIEYDALANTDLVIEAVFEDLAVKHAVFTELDRVCKPGAVLATNTSYLDIDAIARATSRPQDVIGLHFFSPANIMKLLEIVVPAAVSDDVVATAFALADTLRKVPVRAGICDGFIGNRILAAYRTAADALMEDGASPYQIDAAMRSFGFPMGPYQVLDLAGGDIAWAGRTRRAATRDPRARYVQIPDRLCERGWLGQKTGRGYYRYEAGARTGTPDAEVEALIAEERTRAGITPRSFSDDSIVRRCVAAIINEGAKVVEEGIALRPLDVDIALIYGYGFPKAQGGPMFYADATGLARWLDDIHTYAQQDAVFWRPAPLLERCIAQNVPLANFNAA